LLSFVVDRLYFGTAFVAATVVVVVCIVVEVNITVSAAELAFE